LIGIFLKDLTFLEVGNSDTLGDNPKMINFDKLRMIAEVLTEMKNYQQISYDFEVVRELEVYLANMVILSESQLYNYSRMVENKSEHRATVKLPKNFLGLS
jgi:Ras-specific guanine nucleotide-releasing factor 1/Ras-specific guanine nucleotide-releasing factor 2